MGSLLTYVWLVARDRYEETDGSLLQTCVETHLLTSALPEARQRQAKVAELLQGLAGAQQDIQTGLDVSPVRIRSLVLQAIEAKDWVRGSQDGQGSTLDRIAGARDIHDELVRRLGSLKEGLRGRVLALPATAGQGGFASTLRRLEGLAPAVPAGKPQVSWFGLQREVFDGSAPSREAGSLPVSASVVVKRADDAALPQSRSALKPDGTPVPAPQTDAVEDQGLAGRAWTWVKEHKLVTAAAVAGAAALTWWLWPAAAGTAAVVGSVAGSTALVATAAKSTALVTVAAKTTALTTMAAESTALVPVVVPAAEAVAAWGLKSLAAVSLAAAAAGTCYYAARPAESAVAAAPAVAAPRAVSVPKKWELQKLQPFSESICAVEESPWGDREKVGSYLPAPYIWVALGQPGDPGLTPEDWNLYQDQKARCERFQDYQQKAITLERQTVALLNAPAPDKAQLRSVMGQFQTSARDWADLKADPVYRALSKKMKH
jgi:hypothetical protein